MSNLILGIDVGASGIKGALVDVEKGRLSGERFRIPTPVPSTPAAIAEACAEMVRYFNYSGLVGVGFPAIVKNGVALSASNIDEAWIGTNINEAIMRKSPNVQVYSTNDADAAGIAEMRYGVGQKENGLVLMITIGTGLGSALFYRGMMIPNTELGHVIYPKKTVAEKYASSGAREKAKISRKEWADRFAGYLKHMERLFTPDLIILGGGESKLFDQYKERLKTKCRLIPAQLLNNAGIIGAAIYAKEEAVTNPHESSKLHTTL
jgi:polyphosphate glucokinase